MAEDQNHVIIVYDGDCIFCSRSMSWIARHDKRKLIRFTACSSATGSRIMRENGVDPLDPSTFLVLKDGKVYERSEAMLQLASILDPAVRPLVGLRLIPTAIRDAIYNWTARNRRRLMANRQCPVPSPEMRERLIP